jgi:glycosyltransferase involved in cell wall biosynthesis
MEEDAGPLPRPYGLPPLRVAVDATPLLGVRTGVGHFCDELLRALARRGDVAVTAFAVTWRRRGMLDGQLPPGVELAGPAMPARPLRWSWERWPAPAIEWWTGRTDVVHGTNFVAPPARRATAVVTVHDLTTVRFPELCQPENLRFPELIRRALERGAWVHTPSAFVAGEVVQHFGVAPERVQAVHHGVPGAGQVAAGDPQRGRRLARADRYVLALGTVEPRKDLPGLVRAFDLVASEDPEARLAVAGPDGWGVAEFDSAVAAARHRSRIVRLGYLGGTEKADLLAGASVFAFPSLYEGFGLPALEAMAAGVPVVATAAGALPEVLGDGAVVVPVGGVEAMAAAITHLLSDEGDRAELVERGRRRVASFSWERCAEEMVSLYRRAASVGSGQSIS